MEKIGLWVLIVGGFLAINPRLAEPIFIPKQLVMSSGLLILWIALRKKLQFRTELTIFAALFTLAAIAAAATSRDISLSIFGLYEQPFHGFLQIAIVILAFLAAASTCETVIPPMIWTASVLSLVAIAQAGGLLPEPYGTVNHRVISLFGSPVFFGAVISALIPVCAWSALRGAGYLPVMIACVACALTYSRGAYLAAGAGLLVFFLGIVRRPGKRAVVGLLVSAVALLVILWPAGRGKSDAMRIAMWRDSLGAIAKAPILGHGPDTFPLAFREVKTARFLSSAGSDRVIQGSAHNDIIQVAVTMGMIGLLAYGLGIVAVASVGWGLLLAVMVALFVQAKFQPVPMQGFMILALIAGQSVKVCMIDRVERRRAWSAGLVILILCVAASGLAWKADRLFAQGLALGKVGRLDKAAEHIRRANEIMPWNILYATRRCEVIWKLAPYADRARRRVWIMRAVGIARINLRYNGGDPGAHELASTAYLIASGQFGRGFLNDAAREIAIARSMSPLSSFSWRRTQEIAELTGDRKMVEKSQDEIKRIQSIAGGGL